MGQFPDAVVAIFNYKGVVYTGIHRILMSIHGIHGLDSIYLGIHAVYRASIQRVYKNK